MNEKTIINGYEVELEITQEDHGSVSQCFIMRKVDGRLHSASLEALINEGELRCQSSGNRDDYIFRVPDNVIALIELWAIEQGY